MKQRRKLNQCKREKSAKLQRKTVFHPPRVDFLFVGVTFFWIFLSNAFLFVSLNSIFRWLKLLPNFLPPQQPLLMMLLLMLMFLLFFSQKSNSKNQWRQSFPNVEIVRSLFHSILIERLWLCKLTVHICDSILDYYLVSNPTKISATDANVNWERDAGELKATGWSVKTYIVKYLSK